MEKGGENSGNKEEDNMRSTVCVKVSRTVWTGFDSRLNVVGVQSDSRIHKGSKIMTMTSLIYVCPPTCIYLA